MNEKSAIFLLVIYKQADENLEYVFFCRIAVPGTVGDASLRLTHLKGCPGNMLSRRIGYKGGGVLCEWL